MKRLSLLAITAVAALALTAAIGSATASATVLCEKRLSTCPSSQILPAGTVVTFGTNVLELKSDNIKLTGVSGVSFNCRSGGFKETTTAEKGSGSLPATGSRSLSECSQFFYSSCAMSMSGSSDEFNTILGTKLLSGTVTVTASCSGPSDSVVCKWTGHANGTIYQPIEENPYEIVEGNFVLTSASGTGWKESELATVCGGKEAQLKTRPLRLATALVYLEPYPN